MADKWGQRPERTGLSLVKQHDVLKEADIIDLGQEPNLDEIDSFFERYEPFDVEVGDIYEGDGEQWKKWVEMWEVEENKEKVCNKQESIQSEYTVQELLWGRGK